MGMLREANGLVPRLEMRGWRRWVCWLGRGGEMGFFRCGREGDKRYVIVKERKATGLGFL